jgi:hypothetical protein
VNPPNALWIWPLKSHGKSKVKKINAKAQRRGETKKHRGQSMFKSKLTTQIQVETRRAQKHISAWVLHVLFANG